MSGGTNTSEGIRKSLTEELSSKKRAVVLFEGTNTMVSVSGEKNEEETHSHRAAGTSTIRTRVSKRKYLLPYGYDDFLAESMQKESGVSVTLMNLDVLDCSICMKPLSPPVFQCENGHIACSPCCTQLHNKCPCCSSPTGNIRCLAIEKVIESIKVPCAYKPYGCAETVYYMQKETHEATCIYTPCKCPIDGCDFRGSSKQLSPHISSEHLNCITQFHFKQPFSVSLGKLDPFVILQEEEHDILFVLNNQIELIGSAITVECLGPKRLNGGFCCEVTSRKGDNSLRLESRVECVKERTTTCSSVDFLLVPYYIHDKVRLEIRIWERS